MSEDITKDGETPEPEVLEGEVPPGVSTENMTHEEAEAAFKDFLEHVGVPGVQKVFVAAPVVVEGEVVEETPARKAAAEADRAVARAEGAKEAHLEVGEALDEPVSLETSLHVLVATLERAIKAAKVVLATAKAQEKIDLANQPDDSLLEEML